MDNVTVNSPAVAQPIQDATGSTGNPGDVLTSQGEGLPPIWLAPGAALPEPEPGTEPEPPVKPVISTLSPDTIEAGTGTHSCILQGTGFKPGMKVSWGAQVLTPTVVNPTDATVMPTRPATAMAVGVAAMNYEQGIEAVSDPKTFTYTEPEPEPAELVLTLESIEPGTTKAHFKLENATVPVTYDFGDGLTHVPADADTAHTYAAAGTYTVSVVDAAAAEATLEIEVPEPAPLAAIGAALEGPVVVEPEPEPVVESGPGLTIPELPSVESGPEPEPVVEEPVVEPAPELPGLPDLGLGGGPEPEPEPVVEEPVVEEPAVEGPVLGGGLLGTDAEPVVEEPVALEPVVEEPVVEPVYDPSEYTVDEVLTYAGGKGEDELMRLWEAESAGRNRSTLLSGLDKMITELA